jgi:thymidylate synthase
MGIVRAPEYQSIDEAQLAIFDELLTYGERTSPRGMATLESRAVSFAILNPRQRCVMNPARKWSFPLALGETCWHLSGSTAAKDLAYYAPIWLSFADSEGQIRGSCYGSKMFDKQRNPWERVVQLLRKDKDSRRAVLYFNTDHSHMDDNCHDAACAESIQFMIRNGKLDAIVCMRSNDAVWGLPYDVFLFTFLQELLSLQLGVGLGTYYHFTSSLHIYSRHIQLASRVLNYGRSDEFSMPDMCDPEMLEHFLEVESELRMDRPCRNRNISDYWRDLIEVLRLFQESHQFGWQSALEAHPHSIYARVLRPLSKSSSFVAGVDTNATFQLET